MTPLGPVYIDLKKQCLIQKVQILKPYLVWRIYAKRRNRNGYFKCINSIKLHLEVLVVYLFWVYFRWTVLTSLIVLSYVFGEHNDGVDWGSPVFFFLSVCCKTCQKCIWCDNIWAMKCNHAGAKITYLTQYIPFWTNTASHENNLKWFLLSWQNMKWQLFAICKWEKFLIWYQKYCMF